MITKEEKKRKKKLWADLKFYLDNYKEITLRGEKIRKAFDAEVDSIIEELKRIGK